MNSSPLRHFLIYCSVRQAWTIPVGIYTIVDEQDGWGLLKAYAEGRNSWIKLSYTEKV